MVLHTMNRSGHSAACLGRLICLVAFCLALPSGSAAPAGEKKHVVLIAGPKSHGPEGNGIHDYGWSVKLLAAMLRNSDIGDRVRVSPFPEGWPEDVSVLKTADTIMVISDGRDGDRYAETPYLENRERRALMDGLMKRGCGLMTFHFSTFAPDEHAARVLEWTGGYFDWETDGKREWYSAITTAEAEVQIADENHPINRGITPFTMNEEFYYNMRFRDGDRTWIPLWEVPALKGRDPHGNVVAWARERADGGRGFGTTCGHFYDNWKHEGLRKLILNAIAWTAHVEVPEAGVAAPYLDHESITLSLDKGYRFLIKETVLERHIIDALVLTGNDGPFHPWLEKSLALREELQRDPRFQVAVTRHIEALQQPALHAMNVVILNYCNWEHPEGLSEASRQNLIDYLKRGGGLVIVHFSNGAWHSSLPKAGASDWPEYRRICRRVWDHHGDSDHDPYGTFRVEVTRVEHPITTGMTGWDTSDELYFNQAGEEPIEPLITATSKKTGKNEPLAWAYRYGEGRVFQTVLGHDVASIKAPGTAELLRRGAAWAAGVMALTPPDSARVRGTRGTP